MTVASAGTSSRSTVYRVAELHLRGAAGPIRSRAYWPAPAAAATPALLVCFSAAAESEPDSADAMCRWLAAAAGTVAVAVACRGDPDRDRALRDAVTATEWAADHAAELAADPARLLVAGPRAQAGLAAAVALHARDQGWPSLVRQVLIRPLPDPGLLSRSAAGAAPATVATRGRDGARRYAAWLRRAGVPVELVPRSGLGAALRRQLQTLTTNDPTLTTNDPTLTTNEHINQKGLSDV